MPENEYLETFTQLVPDYEKVSYLRAVTIDSFQHRENLVRRYAWAVPNEKAISTIAKYSPLVEIGAGTGYWAHLLREQGALVHAYDKLPPDGSEWTDENDERVSWYHRGFPTHTEVLEGTQDILKTYDPKWNLFLCWPPMDEMAAYALGYHRGKYICYVGEGSGGCNADRLFFKLLERLYRVVETVEIPQWDGIHDYLTVYQRKGR